MKQTGEVMEFRCKREAEDGSFVADYHSGSSKENWAILSAAIEYYRNRQERKAFFDTYNTEHDGATIEALMKSSHKGLLSKFKRHYEKEYKRIKGNPLEQILLKMVDLCEEKGPYVGADYLLLGEMIGDGTMICLSKSDGHMYIADHGEYEDKGEFSEFLVYFLDFLEGI